MTRSLDCYPPSSFLSEAELFAAYGLIRPPSPRERETRTGDLLPVERATSGEDGHEAGWEPFAGVTADGSHPEPVVVRVG